MLPRYLFYSDGFVIFVKNADQIVNLSLVCNEFSYTMSSRYSSTEIGRTHICIFKDSLHFIICIMLLGFFIRKLARYS